MQQGVCANKDHKIFKLKPRVICGKKIHKIWSVENIATNMQNYIKINFYENGHNICKIKQKAVCGKKWLQNIQNSIKGSLRQN